MTKLTRRHLLKGAALAAVASPMIVPRTVFGTEEKAAPSERVTVAHIGVGNMGSGDLGAILACKEAQSIAVADPWQDRRDAAAAIANAKAYADFRKMFDAEKVDAVVVATPNHWHVPAAIYAGKRGIHTYVQKPLGLTIEQDLTILKLFKENNLIFQYGTQQRSMPHCYRGCELVRRGAIGKIKQIEVTAPVDAYTLCYREEVPVPTTLDYDIWIGPAPMVPYFKGQSLSPSHFHIHDYSIGYLADWGAHPLDIMVWGADADLSGPITVEGKGLIPTEGLYNNVIEWNMNIMLGDTPLSYKHGVDMTKYYGEDGRWIDIRRGGLTASDPDILKSFDESAKSILQPSRSGNHEQDFILAIKEGKRAVTSLEEAVRSDIISHLCDIAIRTNSKVSWDPKKFEFISVPDVGKKMVSRSMRAPWTL